MAAPSTLPFTMTPDPSGNVHALRLTPTGDKPAPDSGNEKANKEVQSDARRLSLWEHLQRAREKRGPLRPEVAAKMTERKTWIERVKKWRDDIPIPDQAWFDMLEVSYILNSDKQTLKRMIDKGEIHAEKRGRSWYVSHRNLVRYLDKLERMKVRLEEEGSL